MIRSHDSSAISSSTSIEPASMHSSRLLGSVVAEHDTSAILSKAHPNTKLARASRRPLDRVYEADDSQRVIGLPFGSNVESCCQMGSYLMYAGIAGMSVFLPWVASTTPRMMEHLMPGFHTEPIPIGGGTKS
jgi:hypothetical protein